MLDTGLVKKTVALLGSFDDEEIETYNQLILAASLSVYELLDENADEGDARVIQYAAAKAYYSICCIAENAEGITSFTAGEITVKQNADLKGGAEDVLRAAANDCRPLFKSASELDETNGFAFLGV